MLNQLETFGNKPVLNQLETFGNDEFAIACSILNPPERVLSLNQVIVVIIIIDNNVNIVLGYTIKNMNKPPDHRRISLISAHV